MPAVESGYSCRSAQRHCVTPAASPWPPFRSYHTRRTPGDPLGDVLKIDQKNCIPANDDVGMAAASYRSQNVRHSLIFRDV